MTSIKPQMEGVLHISCKVQMTFSFDTLYFEEVLDLSLCFFLSSLRLGSLKPFSSLVSSKEFLSASYVRIYIIVRANMCIWAYKCIFKQLKFSLAN